MDPTLEFLNAFGFSAADESQSDELEELTFTVRSRIAELLKVVHHDEADRTENCSAEDESLEDGARSYTADINTTFDDHQREEETPASAPAVIVELPPTPDFTTVFKHHKTAHSAQSNIPMAL
ncbi:hypothetical protein FBU30_004864 [Linnemannia zychae]|nr:hypothetical protein FBU30_004864 [Linnemannia zychae]